MKKLLTYQEFEDLSQFDLSIVIAKTKGCSVCVPVSARIEEILKQYPNIPLYQIYLEDVPEFQGQQLIFTVPTVVVYQNGKEILRESRFVDFLKIERLLDLYTDSTL